MTTFQDQPPQSRRALRQEQREERSRAEEIDDSAEAQRSAPSGRRARAAAPDGLVEIPAADPAAETATPATSEPATVEPASAEAHDAEPETPVVSDSAVAKSFPFAEQVEATSDDAGHPGFRLRDFSPELSTSRAESQNARDWAPAEADDESVPLDYQTQGAPAFGYVSPYAEPAAETPPAEPSFDSLFADLVVPAEDAPSEDGPSEHAVHESAAAEASVPEAASVEASVPEPASVEASVSDLAAPTAAETTVPPEERTLSRREWRAMRAAAEAKAEAEAAAAAPAEAVAEEPTPLDVLFHEPEVVQAQSAESIPPLVEPSTAPHSALSDAMAEFEALTRDSTDAAPAAATTPVFDPPVEQPEVPASAEAPTAVPTPAEQPRSPFSFLIDPNAAVAPVVTTDTGSYTPPVGHWSRQAELDDENQPFENTLSRDVGGGNMAAATNALVLPMIPQRDDFSSVLNATGEIMVTGTINLPGSVAATGRDSRHYDDPEVDHLFDAFDNEIANTDSAPVRAITAVSSHTATRGGIESGRKQSNRMLNVLLVTASVMAVAVAGLLFAGFVFNIF